MDNKNASGQWLANTISSHAFLRVQELQEISNNLYDHFVSTHGDVSVSEAKIILIMLSELIEDRARLIYSPVENLMQNKNTPERVQMKKKDGHMPSLEEITRYCQEINSTINPEHFYTFYESKNRKFKDWKKMVRLWDRSQSSESSMQSNIVPHES